MLSIFGAVRTGCASKGRAVQLTKSLATTWAKDNIQVNAVLPGWIDTDLTQNARKGVGLNSMVLMRTPARRWGCPMICPASPCSWRVRPPAITGTAPGRWRLLNQV
jgi:2-deoxy-D-gluconate 3-dehydrogenase